MVSIPAPRFSEVMFQLLLRFAPTLPDVTYLLRRRRCMGMLVGLMIRRCPVVVSAHKSIVPLVWPVREDPACRRPGSSAERCTTSGCGPCPRRPWSLAGSPAALMEEPSRSDEHCADDQKADVPGERSAEVIPDMVHLKYVVIDQTFDDIEDAPAHDNEAEVEAPVGRQASPAPRGDRGYRRGQQEQPHCQMEEPVRECVDFKAGHRGGRVLRSMAEHVVPLQDLVQDDAVKKSTQPQPEKKARKPRGRCRTATGLHPWIGHAHTLLPEESGENLPRGASGT
jgi:hypothetical protein